MNIYNEHANYPINVTLIPRPFHHLAFVVGIQKLDKIGRPGNEAILTLMGADIIYMQSHCTALST